jgi:hypothetical protein
MVPAKSSRRECCGRVSPSNWIMPATARIVESRG